MTSEWIIQAPFVDRNPSKYFKSGPSLFVGKAISSQDRTRDVEVEAVLCCRKNRSQVNCVGFFCSSSWSRRDEDEKVTARYKADRHIGREATFVGEKVEEWIDCEKKNWFAWEKCLPNLDRTSFILKKDWRGYDFANFLTKEPKGMLLRGARKIFLAENDQRISFSAKELR